MNQKEAKTHGIDQGYAAGIYGTDEAKNEEDFISEAFESEQNARSFSPFEFFAYEVNCCNGDRSDGLWDAYDDGVMVGINKALKERSFSE